MSKFIDPASVVWARLKYCVFWPGRIVTNPPSEIPKIAPNNICVFFFGSKTYGSVEMKNMCSYSENRDKLIKKGSCRGSKFLTAVSQCDEFLSDPVKFRCHAVVNDMASTITVQNQHGPSQIKQEPKDEDDNLCIYTSIPVQSVALTRYQANKPLTDEVLQKSEHSACSSAVVLQKTFMANKMDKKNESKYDDMCVEAESLDPTRDQQKVPSNQWLVNEAMQKREQVLLSSQTASFQNEFMANKTTQKNDNLLYQIKILQDHSLTAQATHHTEHESWLTQIKELQNQYTANEAVQNSERESWMSQIKMIREILAEKDASQKTERESWLKQINDLKQRSSAFTKGQQDERSNWFSQVKLLQDQISKNAAFYSSERVSWLTQIKVLQDQISESETAHQKERESWLAQIKILQDHISTKETAQNNEREIWLNTINKFQDKILADETAQENMKSQLEKISAEKEELAAQLKVSKEFQLSTESIRQVEKEKLISKVAKMKKIKRKAEKKCHTMFKLWKQKDERHKFWYGRFRMLSRIHRTMRTQIRHLEGKRMLVAAEMMNECRKAKNFQIE